MIFGAMPYNATTGKEYTGGNAEILMKAAASMGTSDPRWCTFLQAKSAGWKVRKGATGIKLQKWGAKTRKGENGEEVDSVEGKPKLLKKFVVFHASQLEGIPALDGGEVLEAAPAPIKAKAEAQNIQLCFDF